MKLAPLALAQQTNYLWKTKLERSAYVRLLFVSFFVCVSVHVRTIIATAVYISSAFIRLLAT